MQNTTEIIQKKSSGQETRFQVYEMFFMLNSNEHVI